MISPERREAAMNDLVANLRERLDEDERVANSLDDDDDMPGLTICSCLGYPCETYLSTGKQRVLRWVAAAREILRLYEEHKHFAVGQSYPVAEESALMADALEPAIRALASIYREEVAAAE